MNPTDLSDTKSEEIKQLKKLISHLQEVKKQLQEENQQLKKKFKDTTTCSTCDEEAEMCAACGLMICTKCLTYNSGSCESCEVYLCMSCAGKTWCRNHNEEDSCADKTWCRNHNTEDSVVQFCTICPTEMKKCPSCDKSNILVQD